MKLDKSFAVVLTFFCLAFSVSLYASVVYPKPVGADVVFHLDVVDAYLRGENGMFAPHVMEINRIPYPPLFHLLVLPSRAFGFSNVFLLGLQALLYPLLLVFAVKIACDYGGGWKHGLIVGFGLLGSYAYLDATFQMRPESLDVLFFLLVLYSALAVKPKLGTLSVVLGVYNHSVPSLIQNMGILLKQKNVKQLIVIALACSPILVISAWYALPMLGRWVGSPASDQAKAFLTNWPIFTVTYLGALVIGLPIAFAEAYEWKQLNPLAKFSLLTVVSCLLLVPVWYDRYYQYISVPLAILIGDFIVTRKQNLRYVALYLTFFVLAFFIINYANLWLVNFQGGWDIH